MEICDSAHSFLNAPIQKQSELSQGCDWAFSNTR